MTPDDRAATRLTSRANTPTAASVASVVSAASRTRSRQEQEISLGITLVAISVLFISCQSVKIIPDLYELTCKKDENSNMECESTKFIDTIIRCVYKMTTSFALCR